MISGQYTWNKLSWDPTQHNYSLSSTCTVPTVPCLRVKKNKLMAFLICTNKQMDLIQVNFWKSTLPFIIDSPQIKIFYKVNNSIQIYVLTCNEISESSGNQTDSKAALFSATHKEKMQCSGAEIIYFRLILGSGSCFVRNFGSSSSSCHILPQKTVL